MSLVSTQYGIFLAAVCLLCYALPARIAPTLLLIASLGFYAMGNLAHLPVLAAVILASYIGGRILKRRRSAGILWICIVATAAPLLWFKFVRTDELAPGASFFTLAAIGYLVDAFRGEAPEASLPVHSLFVCFFPAVLAGPIERAGHLIPQLIKREPAQVSRGLFQIMNGVVIKCVVADNLASFVNGVYADLAHQTPGNALVACYLYTLQIYCDFLGYTLIALGSAALVGISLIRNFDHPYFATNIQSFWSRWHISLTTWLRDYVYFSMGGLRRPVNRYRNLLVTWLITGLWHGVGITYVIWGAMHGVALSVYHLFRSSRRKRPLVTKAWMGIPVRLAAWLVTFHFVVLSWIPFRAASWAQARMMFGKVFQAVTALPAFAAPDSSLVFLLRVAVIFGALEILDWFVGGEDVFLKLPAVCQAAWLALLFCATYLAPLSNITFVYVQF